MIQPTDTKRRSFLRAWGRWSALALLGGGLAALVGKRGLEAPLAACNRDRICSRCNQAGNCVQPEAMSFREAQNHQP